MKTILFKRTGLYFLRILDAYFRLEIEGLENVPPGPAVIAPNHSGFAGTDALLLAYAIRRATRRRPKILAHRTFFELSRKIRLLAKDIGLRKASIQEGLSVLRKNNLLIVFPEGEHGNFKPSMHRYKLQRFRSGFLRIAAQAKAPVVPCLILGAEESHLNLGNLRISIGTDNRKLMLPLPLNLVPLPAKWKIVFLPPIAPPAPETLSQPEIFRIATESFQRRLQSELSVRRRSRPYVFFPGTRELERGAFHRISRFRRRLRSAHRSFIRNSRPALPTHR